MRDDGVLMMPELALAEAAQVLWQKEQQGAMTGAEVGEVLEAILDLPIETPGHRDLIADATALAREHSLTVYDALFMAAAVRRGASLITADEDLRRAFGKLT